MASTSAAPSSTAQHAEDGNAASAQGGIDRDVTSILAGLNQEQLASIVAAARASEGGEGGEGLGSSGADASSILASLPPGLGQAASALTALTSSLKKDEEGDDGEAQAPDGEHDAQRKAAEAGAEEGQQLEGAEGADGEQAADGEAATAEHEQGNEQYEDQSHIAQAEHQEGEAKGDESYADQTQDVDESKLGDDSVQAGNETSDDYRNENATQAAIAAMESLAAQSSMNLYGQSNDGRSSSQARRRDTGPEAERLRKDQHKEVERKRREQISNGITELQAIVPGCDSKGINKTAIINAAVRYIQELKNNEASNIEKWTLEKLLMDQAMNDLQQQLEHVRKENSSFREQLGLPEPAEEPVTAEHEHYGGEHEGTAEGAEDAQQPHEGDVAMEEQANGQHDDANLDPALGKQVAAEGNEDEKKDVEQAADDSAVANGAVAAAADEKVAGHTRSAEHIADDAATDGVPAKRTRHA